MSQAQRNKAWRVVAVVGGIVALVALALVVWNNGVKDRIFARNLGVVEPGRIYRSGLISANLIEGVLRENKIKTVVSLTWDDPNDRNTIEEHRASKALGVAWYNYPLSGDGTGDLKNYVGALSAMIRSDRAGKPVLVHCNAGAQRTGAAVAFYRLLVQRWPADRVEAELFRFGHDPKNNPDLIAYVNANRRALARALAAQGLIEEPGEIPELAAR